MSLPVHLFPLLPRALRHDPSLPSRRSGTAASRDQRGNLRETTLSPEDAAPPL